MSKKMKSIHIRLLIILYYIFTFWIFDSTFLQIITSIVWIIIPIAIYYATYNKELYNENLKEVSIKQNKSIRLIDRNIRNNLLYTFWSDDKIAFYICSLVIILHGGFIYMSIFAFSHFSRYLIAKTNFKYIR